MEFLEFQFRRLRRQIATGRAAVWGLVSPDMSPPMFFLDFVVYPSIIIACLFIAFDNSGYEQWLKSLTLVVSGYWFWTLAEYIVHRFVLHRVPLFSTLHKAHHAAPRELIGTPTVFSLAVFYCFAFWPIAEYDGVQPAASWLAGLLAGYFWYVAVHYAVHHFGSGGYSFIKRLKRQHAVHHHGEGECNFGVTTTLWDRLFGTLNAR